MQRPRAVRAQDGDIRTLLARNLLIVPTEETSTISGRDVRRMKFMEIMNPREIRRRLGLNQQEFWTKIGVTQSGGSRYESGRNMPKPVRELLRLVHVERVDLARVRKEDFEIIEHLKSSDPQLYQTLRRAAKGKRRKGAETEH